MKNLQATFQIVTPMFLGGADQKVTSIRPASIKGALRFWWRALNWSKHPNLQSLHKQEAQLFGAAASDNDGGGQGVFLMRVCNQKITPKKEPFQSAGNGLKYLMGQGIGSRNAIAEKGEFTIKFIFRPTTSDDDKLQISNTLLLFGLLGALGSRARHGMGSIAITSWSGCEKLCKKLPENREKYVEILEELLPEISSNTHPTGLPPFTAFSEESRIDFSKTHSNSEKLLNEIGLEQQMYRSYGQQGKVNGKDAEQNFVFDHDLILKATNGISIKEAPKRVVFGLPHNYFFSSTKGKADVNYAPDGKEGRRSSPLLLHIHPVDDEFIAVHTLLPAQFLPCNATIRVKSRNTSFVPAAVDWTVLHDYLNRFEGKTIYGRNNE